MRVLKGHRGKLRAVVYSPDGSRLATAGDDGLTKLWDVTTGREVSTMGQPEVRQEVKYLAFSPDGTLLATATTTTVRVWSLEPGKEDSFLALAGSHGGLSLAFTPDGELLVITHWSGHQPKGSVLAFNRRTGTIGTPFGVQAVIAKDVAVSASANLLAVPFQDGQERYVGLWALDSKQLLGVLDHEEEYIPSFQALAFSADGQTLAVAGGPRVFVWDVPGRRMRGRIEGHANQVNDVAFSPDNTLLASASHDGTVRFWDVETLRERAVYDWETGKAFCVAFSPDGMTAAAAGERRKVIVWDVE
jgi:hypothetical protein